MIKKTLTYLFIMLAMMTTSCNDKELLTNSTDVTHEETASLSEAQAQKEFAIILSKAAYKSSKLRSFLKENAQKQFDNNYEVFYPYTKTSQVEDGKTFRQLMVENSSEAEIRAIEKATPLLTVFIPDLSMFNAFDVNKWDVSKQEILVTYDKGNRQTIFYENGKEEFQLSAMEVPAFPFLLVKSTKRMKVVGTTRSNGNSEPVYDFAHDIYRPQPKTRAEWRYSTVKNDTLPIDTYVNKNEISPLVIEAYNACKGDDYSLQRDYIYYGLSKANPTNGKLRPNIREKFIKFKVNPNALDRISDYQSNLDNDPYLEEAYFKRYDPDLAEIIRNVWHEGKFTFVFEFFWGNRTQTMSPIEIRIDVPAADLFHVDSLHRAYQHSTFFRKSKYVYTVKVEDISPKWVRMPENQNLISPSSWDLSTLATNVYVKAKEFDEGYKQSKTVTYSSTFAQKGNFGLEAGFDKIKMILGINLDHSSSKSHSITIEESNNSDDLGACYINYTDKVILSDDKANQGLYKVKTYGTGNVEFMIIPIVE